MREQISLKIHRRAFNSGGKGGQHSNKTLNAMEVSVTLPDGRRIVATSSSHKSQWRNKAVAEATLVGRVREALTPKHQDTRSAEQVRTYHAVRNQVTDHASGERRSYTSVMDGDGFGELVDARRRELAMRKAAK